MTKAPDPLEDEARDAREAAQRLAELHKEARAEHPKRWRTRVLKEFRIGLPKGRPGRPQNPIVVKAVEMKCAGRSWPAIYRECIPDHQALTAKQQRARQHNLRSRVRARISRLRLEGKQSP